MKSLLGKAFLFCAALIVANMASIVSAQGHGSRIHSWAANSFGGANCGRTISQADAEGLWSTYCHDDCSISLDGGCGGGCGSGRGHRDHGCGSGFGHGGGFLSRGGRGGADTCGGDCGGNRDFGCNNGCFGWPAGAGCSTGCGGFANRVGHGSFFHRDRGGCGGGCDQDRGCDSGRSFGSRFGGHFGSRSGQDGCGCDSGLFNHGNQCGKRCRLFDRSKSNFDDCSPIMSCVGNQLTRSCGCDGGSNYYAPAATSPSVMQPPAHAETPAAPTAPAQGN